MADWRITQHLFGDETGPLPAILVFDNNVSQLDIDAIEHNFPFTSDPLHKFDNEIIVFFELFGHHLGSSFNITADADYMWLVEFTNERIVRAEGSSILMSLVSRGTLLGAYKMTEGDRTSLIELNRQLKEIRTIYSLSLELQCALRQHTFRIANNPAYYIRNFADIKNEFGVFEYEMADGLVDFDIDHSRIREYEGLYDDLLFALISIPQRNYDEHREKLRAFIQDLKLTS